MTQPTTTPTNPTVKVSRDLAEIVDLSTQLLGQAVHDANAQIDGTSLPGGRAMIALAGVGDTATFERRVETAERAWFQWHHDDQVKLVDGYSVIPDDGTRPDPAADEDDDTAPALQILRYWSEQYRWQVGAVWDHIPTINTEAKFLRHQLNWIAEHDAAQWAPFAKDINRARRHLETIVHAGNRPDRSRVVCNNPKCDDPKKLIKVHGPTYVTAWACRVCDTTIPEARSCSSCHRTIAPGPDEVCHRLVGKKGERHECGGAITSTVDVAHCPNPWCHTAAPAVEVLASNEETDRWKCTGCKRRYDADDYYAAHRDMLRHGDAAKFVSLPDAIATLVKQGRPEVTVRSWLKPPRRHEADRCRLCKRTWPPQEHNVCPGRVEGTLERCGGELRPVRRGNPDEVIEGYCDMKTHRVLVWWPDLWRRHLTTLAKAETATARAASRQNAEQEEGPDAGRAS